MDRAEGAVIITGQEVGNNVVFSHRGSIDLEGAGFTFFSDASVGKTSSFDVQNSKPTFTDISIATDNLYSLYFAKFKSRPANGVSTKNNQVDADSFSGDAFAIEDFRDIASNKFLAFPINYVNGNKISGSATYNNTTLFDLGFDASQTYDWVLLNDDFIRLQFKTTPEPSTILGSILVLGLGAVMGKTKKK